MAKKPTSTSLGNRSSQERNIYEQYWNLSERLDGKNPVPITLVGRNNYEIRDIVELKYHPGGDSSAADLVGITSSGAEYIISCKKYNPINFCGSGLRSFSEDTTNGMIMKKWMKKVLGEIIAYYNSFLSQKKDEMMERIGNIILNDIKKNPSSNSLSNKTNEKIQDEYEEFKSINLPAIYIEIPKSFRSDIFYASTLGGPITHYILNGSASSIRVDNVDNKKLVISDCDILTTENLIGSNEMIYLYIRKRRSDQCFDLTERQNPIVNKNGFARIFGESAKKPGERGARVQIREQSQLPNNISRELLLDNTSKKTNVPANSIILRVPL